MSNTTMGFNICAILRLLIFIFLITSLPFWGFSQDKIPLSLSLKIGAGSSISTQLFFADNSFNTPGSHYINLGLSTNFRYRNDKSLYAGLEIQTVNYYPNLIEKSSLAFVSLLIGKTRRFDLSKQIYLKQTNGLTLNSLLEQTSSNPSSKIYSGTPFTNINAGAFSNLQVLFSGEQRKKRNIDCGLGIDIAYKGVQIFKDGNYPAYLINTQFIQYGLSFNMNYKF